MPGYNVQTLEVRPDLDLELLLSNSQETRIDGKLMDKLVVKWAEWMQDLHASVINLEGQSYLTVWLGEAVEESVDDIWDDSPGDAFLYNALAQTLCMSAIYDLIPEVAEAGCAPAPKPTPDLNLALEKESLRDSSNEDLELNLCRRYAVATYYPFRGGCDICHLQALCPKLKSGAEDYSVTLPGFGLSG